MKLASVRALVYKERTFNNRESDRNLWARTDFLSQPELTPSGHGLTSYCETNLVWELKVLEEVWYVPLFRGSWFF